jgi:hypothetical protein
MKQPGLDNRHRDKDGQIRQKRGDTLNKNLSQPIPEFSPNAKLQTMRDATGQTSERAVREAAKKILP